MKCSLIILFYLKVLSYSRFSVQESSVGRASRSGSRRPGLEPDSGNLGKVKSHLTSHIFELSEAHRLFDYNFMRLVVASTVENLSS